MLQWLWNHDINLFVFLVFLISFIVAMIALFIELRHEIADRILLNEKFREVYEELKLLKERTRDAENAPTNHG